MKEIIEGLAKIERALDKVDTHGAQSCVNLGMAIMQLNEILQSLVAIDTGGMVQPEKTSDGIEFEGG